MPLFDLAYTGPPDPVGGQLPLREDCTGLAMLLTGAARLTNGNAPILYDQGFTVEMAIKPTTIGVRAVGGGTSRIVPGVQSHANANDQSIFQLGFDNWASGGARLVPTFTILSDNNTYQSLLDHAVILGEARGSTFMVLGNTYHLLGTLDTAGLCQLYVNGVLEATASPNINMVDFISAANANLDLGNAARTLRDVFDIGTRFLDGAYRTEPDTGEAVIDNVRFYDEHFSATQAAAAAAEVNFTEDPVADDATAYVLDEVSASDPGGAGTPRLDMFWKFDGTRVFTCRQSDRISQNDVSPAWGIQTGNWTNLVSTAAIANLRSIWWSPDGTRLSRCTRVPSFNMNVTVFDQSATPFDLTVLGSSTTKTFPVTPALSGGPADHVWSEDGLTLWVHYQSVPSSVYEWSVTVPFDPSTLIQPQNKSFDFIPDAGTDMTTFGFSLDGTQMYGMDGQFLVSWDLTTAFDVSTATNFQTGPTVFSGDVGIPRGLNVRPDNADIVVEGDQNLRKAAWFRIPTVFQDADEYCLKTDDVTPEPFSSPGGSRRDVRFRPDGLRAWTQWTISVGGFNLHQYDLPAPWQLTGWTPSGNVLFPAANGDSRSMTWHDNGNKLTFLTRWFAGLRRVDTFDMSATPYDISSGLGPGFASLTAITGPGEYMVKFSLDGLKMFTDISAVTMQRYNLAVAHDISSSTGVDQTWNYGVAGAGSTNTWGFSPDHKKVYFHTGSNLLGSFDLTAVDDISAPFNFVTGVSSNLPTNLQVARGLTIRPDNGDFILLADQNNQRIRSWNA